VLLFLLLKLNAYGLDFGAWFEQNPQADFQVAVEELNDERERERGRVSQKSLRSKGTGQILEREIVSPVSRRADTWVQAKMSLRAVQYCEQADI
jgi:hypothetical protein